MEFCEQMWYPSFSLKLKAPTMLPELHLLKRVSIDDERYHKLTFENLEALRHLLDKGQGILNVKQKAGNLKKTHKFFELDFLKFSGLLCIF